jgi:hypothetical protein
VSKEQVEKVAEQIDVVARFMRSLAEAHNYSEQVFNALLAERNDLRAQLATVIRERDELANWKAASERAYADRIAVETQILRNRIDRNKGHE